MHKMQSGGWPYSKVGRDSSNAPSLHVAVLHGSAFINLLFGACTKGYVLNSCLAPPLNPAVGHISFQKAYKPAFLVRFVVSLICFCRVLCMVAWLWLEMPGMLPNRSSENRG